MKHWNFPHVHSPFFNEIVDGLELTNFERSVATDLNEKGYAKFELDEPNFTDLSEQAISDLDGHHSGPHHKVLNGWRHSEAVQQIAANKPIIDLLTKIYGKPAFPFQTLNFDYGSEQHYHTDAVHFSSVPFGFMCGVWVALEDITESNGPLEYYEGSHTHNCADYVDLGLRASDEERAYAFYSQYEEFWRELVRVNAWERRLLTCKKGTALIWAANLIHGGSSHVNKSQTRHSQVTHYYFDDCSYYTPMGSDLIAGKVHWKNIVDVRTGEVVSNKICGKDNPHW